MATTQKALDLSLQVCNKIRQQVERDLPVVVKSSDSLGNPVVTFSADSSPAAGEKVVVVQVRPFITGTATDVFGNTAQAYCPHIIALCTESNPSGGSGADVLSAADLLPFMMEIGRCGTIVEWHKTTNGVVPSAAAIVAGTSLVASWKPLYFGVQSAI
jgi:hypothetical protein